ncbi:MAG: hypothetical protein DMD53_02535 [Gemmatimonadetes bacterium]|nr:MAG: hypothetical protein DMD53_02535 [Gemmatimonadota bacterium]
MLLVACAGAGFLIFLWLTPHGRQGRPERPSAPTAAEEGGGVGEITTASPRAQVSGPGTAAPARRPVAPHHVVQVGPLTPPVMPEYGVGVGVSSGKGQIGEREDSSKPSSGGDQPLAEKPAAPVRESDRAPFLTPPVLLTPVAGYPAGGYRVVLDRSVLTPQLRVEAAQGRVVLRMLVRSDGSVAQVNVVESSGSQVLDEAAVNAAVKWRFAPASRDGQPVESWAIIPIRFVIP